MKKKSIKAEDFDLDFHQGEDIADYLDVSKAIRPSQNQKRVNVDFPVWMITSLDKQARKLGVTRQSIIKMWIADKLKESVYQID